MVVNATIETVGVASIFPFSGGARESRDRRKQSCPTVGLRGVWVASMNRFLVFLGGASLIALVGSAFVRIVTEYATLRFVDMRGHSLSSRLLQRHLRQPYTFFLNRNSTDLAKGILSEVDSVAGRSAPG